MEKNKEMVKVIFYYTEYPVAKKGVAFDTIWDKYPENLNKTFGHNKYYFFI